MSAVGEERSSGRLTTTIPRPANRRASDAGQPRLGTPKRRRRGLAPRSTTWLFALLGVGIAGALAFVLFALPVRTWFDQEDRIEALERELAQMRVVNAELDAEVASLQTDDGLRDAIREELGRNQAREQVQVITPFPPLPREFPSGWPYDQYDQILAMRELATSGQPVSAASTADGA